MVSSQLRVLRSIKGDIVEKRQIPHLKSGLFSELLKRPLYCMWKGFEHQNLETANQNDSKAEILSMESYRVSGELLTLSSQFFPLRCWQGPVSLWDYLGDRMELHGEGGRQCLAW